MPPKSHKNKGGHTTVRSDASDNSKASSSKTQLGPTWVQPKSITHPEHHHTLNHLYQVAAFYSILACSADLSTNAEEAGTAGRLEGEFIRAAKTLSRKAVIRLDTGVKRLSCPRCDAVWVEGLTVSVRSKANGPHDHVVVKKCEVCGGGVRVPAPNLVMVGRSDEGARELEDGQEIRNKRENEEGAERQAARKRSQRQRKRTASIKKSLLHGSTTPSARIADKLKLSRRQKRQQRLARLATQPPAATPAPAPNIPAATTPPTQPSSANTDAEDDRPDSSALSLSRSGRAAERPYLPHFNDRVQGSHWDDGLAALQTLITSQTEDAQAKMDADNAQQDSIDRAYASQALEYYEKAARSRGDHIVIAGVGKNGALGPTIP